MHGKNEILYVQSEFDSLSVRLIFVFHLPAKLTFIWFIFRDDGLVPIVFFCIYHPESEDLDRGIRVRDLLDNFLIRLVIRFAQLRLRDRSLGQLFFDVVPTLISLTIDTIVACGDLVVQCLLSGICRLVKLVVSLCTIEDELPSNHVFVGLSRRTKERFGNFLLESVDVFVSAIVIRILFLAFLFLDARARLL